MVAQQVLYLSIKSSTQVMCRLVCNREICGKLGQLHQSSVMDKEDCCIIKFLQRAKQVHDVLFDVHKGVCPTYAITKH